MPPDLLADLAMLPKPGDPDAAERGLADWSAAAGAPDSEFERAMLAALFGNAPFLGRCALRWPDALRAVLRNGPDAALSHLLDALDGDVADARDDEAKVARALRRARQRAALVIAAGNIAAVWDDRRAAAALTRFADAAIAHAVDHLLRQARRGGELEIRDPDAPGPGSGFVVLAMGKLGGGELNYSSDVDLIALYDADAAPTTGRRPPQDIFVRLTRRLGRLLEERDADGYVFRTDFRLRPDPAATPIAVSVAAAEGYYASLGQNWERAAMIKARPVAGDLAAADAFLRALRPFVWRKHLDFAAIRDVQSIKRQIRRHNGGTAGAGHDVKLGRGGIREIEFFTQTQQLIWGGRDPSLRARDTETALDALAAAGRVGVGEARELVESYWYLRRVEHRLQMVEDRQTHRLPEGESELARIAAFLGDRDADSFLAALRRHLDRVAQHCEELFDDAAPLGARLPGGGNLVFTNADPDPETLETLRRMGFAEAESISAAIRGWHHGRMAATRSARARELLTELTPGLLEALSDTANPDQAFVSFDAFLRRLSAGVQLFSLFAARPALLGLIAEIVGSAPRIARHLGAHADGLDAVLTEGFFDDLPDLAERRRSLAEALKPAADLQDRLEIARKWTAEAKFRVSVQQLLGKRAAREAGPALSDIADTAVEAMLDAVGDEFAARHGRFADGGLAAIGFGKAGSRMLSRGSDLDLGFVYDGAGATASDGRRGLAPPAYYARLGQRLITALSAQSGAGMLYNVDMRLRPMGDDGPLASDIAAFERYYRESAWTWEEMALTRARVVCGPPALAARLRASIEAVLTRPRDPGRLAREVADMRSRVFAEHGTDDPLDIKHVRGGLFELEFIAQFLLLREAHRHPEALRADTREAFLALRGAGVLRRDETETLTGACDLYYDVQAMLRLSVSGRLEEDAAPEGLRRILARAGGVGDFAALKRKLARVQARVRALFESLIESAADWKEGDNRR